VSVDTDAEVFRLRALLRDLLAVSAVTAAWTEREPRAVATGLADALIGLLELDFAFVRLSDPGGAAAIDVTRGGAAWKQFPAWLESRLGESVQFSRRQIVPDVGGGLEPCRGFVSPIGVNGEAGLVAVACARRDFPSEVDQLLLSYATNQAATAFQTSCLIQERFRDLRESRRKIEESRAELAASRARILTAADEERRRVVRDLHDGAQQRLVHTIVTLKLARRALERDRQDADTLLNEALRQAQAATDELRELAHGILPSVLADGGLRAGVSALASMMPIPVEIDISAQSLPGAAEATAYFIVAEALTNIAKHSHAHRATVKARLENGTLHVEVRDDGVGGAQATGSGLVGLGDRLAALDGSLRIESPFERGTLIAAAIPVA
jgi:signal transduction histidine kinase